MRSLIGTALLFAVVTPALAEDDPYKTLRSPSADASSYLQTNWNRFTENYHPTYVLDEEPSTAWTEGVDGLGEGQVLTLPLSHVTSARSVQVRIRNGYQKSRGLLAANAAPQNVRITMTDANGVVTGQVEATLEKEMGWQTVVVPMNGNGFDSLALEVLSAHPGTRYNDTCISDILVGVDSDVPYSEHAEAGRLHQARAWIAERVQAAQYFANLPPEYPFHPQGYHQDERPVDAAVAAQRLDGERQRLMALKADPAWYDVSMVRRIEATNGLWPFEHVMQLFVPTNVAWFEADGPRDTVVEDRIPEEDWVIGSVTTSRDKVRFSDDSHSVPREVYRHVHSVQNGRGLYIEDVDILARFNDAGRLASVYTETNSDMEGDTGSSSALYQFTYDGDGKLVRWETTERWRPTGDGANESFTYRGSLGTVMGG